MPRRCLRLPEEALLPARLRRPFSMRSFFPSSHALGKAHPPLFLFLKSKSPLLRIGTKQGTTGHIAVPPCLPESKHKRVVPKGRIIRGTTQFIFIRSTLNPLTQVSRHSLLCFQPCSSGTNFLISPPPVPTLCRLSVRLVKSVLFSISTFDMCPL